MKKLTWALLSLMLFLGLGTAFAQVPAPSFDLSEGTTVTQGQPLELTWPKNLELGTFDYRFIIYVENNNDAELKYGETLQDFATLAYGGGGAGPMEPLSAKAGDAESTPAYKVAIYDDMDGWNPAITLSEVGTVKVRARLAIGDGWNAAPQYSDVFDATYTVEEVKIPLPTLWIGNTQVQSVLPGVAKTAELTLKTGYEETEESSNYIVIYSLDGSDDDFEDIDIASIYMGKSSLKMYDPDEEPLVMGEATTIKAVTGYMETMESTPIYSEIATFEVKSAQLSLAPMVDGMVGKNAAVTVHINDGTVNPNIGTVYVDWMKPITVYYTTDGTTEPSKEAYEAQGENGAIKKVETPYEEADGEIYPTGEATLMFSSNVHLKAKGYYTDEDENEIVTSLFDQELTVKSESNPVLDPADVTAFMIGDKLVIKNPVPAPGEDDEDYEDYDAQYGTQLYFSFDGTEPSEDDYYEQEEFSIFRSKAGMDVEMTFGQDANGLYIYVPEIMGYASPADKIRIPEDADGKFTFKVVAVSYAATGSINMQGRPEMMPYGSDIVTVEYTVEGLPETVTPPTFVPAAGSVAKGESISWTMDASYGKYTEHGGELYVAYVINGTDAQLTSIDAATLENLIKDHATSYTGREEGKVYLYQEEKDAFQIEKGVSVKACQIVAISLLSKRDESYDENGDLQVEEEYTIQLAKSTVVEAEYTVDASKLQKPSFKTPLAGSTVKPNSPITFEMPSEYNWSAYLNQAYILYVENNDDVKLEGTAEEIASAVPDAPATGAKAGEPGYKVVSCFNDPATGVLSWTKALIETQEGALKIRARLAGITLNNEVFYSDEITVSCTVGESEGPGDDPQNPDLPATVKAPVFVPAAGEVEKGTAITWTWDEEAYNEEKYPLVAVAYVVNGTDAELDITAENFGKLWDDSQDEDANTVREEGVTYLYRTDDAYPYQVEEACTVKARLILGTINDKGEKEIALSSVVTAAYTVKGDDVPGNPTLPETVKAPVFVPAAGEVEKGTAITWTWDEEYTEETYPLITVAYVVNGKDEDLDIDVDKFGELWDASQEEDETTVREEGKVYLYRTDVDDAYPYQVEEACTVKARLILGTVNDESEVEIALSKLVEAAYTVLTANEGEELYGVSVYPNPSNGTFNLELPVAATVEVFAANGVLMQRFNANEGNVSLNVNRAGIYFLRITGEGRTSVKRLIVR